MDATRIKEHFYNYVRENGLAEDSFTLSQSFDEAGFDSVMLLMMVVYFETECGLKVDFDLLQVDKDSSIETFLNRVAEFNQAEAAALAA